MYPQRTLHVHDLRPWEFGGGVGGGLGGLGRGGRGLGPGVGESGGRGTGMVAVPSKVKADGGGIREK